MTPWEVSRSLGELHGQLPSGKWDPSCSRVFLGRVRTGEKLSGRGVANVTPWLGDANGYELPSCFFSFVSGGLICMGCCVNQTVGTEKSMSHGEHLGVQRFYELSMIRTCQENRKDPSPCQLHLNQSTPWSSSSLLPYLNELRKLTKGSLFYTKVTRPELKKPSQPASEFCHRPLSKIWTVESSGQNHPTGSPKAKQSKGRAEIGYTLGSGRTLSCRWIRCHPGTRFT